MFQKTSIILKYIFAQMFSLSILTTYVSQIILL